MKKIQFLFLLPILLFAGMAHAQDKVITGKVTNKQNGESLSGVSVIADKKKGAVATKDDGTYSITVAKSSTTLIFSYVGFGTQTVSIEGKTTIDVALVSNTTALDEVVVIAYGTQKRAAVTGAISKYQNEKLDESPVSRIDQALQGKIAGVQITNVSSEAGSDPKIRVRGTTSITASADPLVVVDGHPVPDGLAFVNMADVQSIEVLKDAASAAIYGSRGAGGVIMVTTKSGKSDKPKYSLKFSTGFKTQYDLYPMMTTTEYTNLLFYEAALKSKDPSITPPTGTAIIANNERAAYIVENTIMGGHGTDWQQEALRNATVRNVQLNVSGGNKTVRYYLSGAYQRDQGMMYHSEYDKFNVRSKMDVQLNKKAKFTININPSYSKRERPSVNFIDFVRFQSFLPVYHTDASAAFVNAGTAFVVRPGEYAQARHFNARPYSGLMPDGTTYTSTGALDPFNTANNTPKSAMETHTITSNEYRLTSSGDLTYNIFPGLDFKTMASAYVNYTTAVDFAKRNSNRDGDVNKGIYNTRTFIDLLSENTLNYTRQFKNHSLNVLAGFTAQSTRIKEEQITGLDYPSDQVQTANNALQILAPAYDANGNLTGSFTQKNRTGLLSWLGRAIYGYKNKYLLTASIRADGSSYFAPGKKWGYFPAVTAGWVMTQEKFMEKIEWINNLKLRGSYGVSGNNRLNNYYPFVDLLYSANYPFGGNTGTSVIGQVPSRDFIANKDITWESTFQFNAGIDLSIFNNAVALSIDAYQSKTDALLLKQASLAITGAPFFYNNIGKLQNRGIELEITTNNFRKKNFKWQTVGNISHNRNKLVKLGEEALLSNQGERTEVYINKVGGPLIQYFGYKTDGVWLSQKQIDDARAAGLTSGLSNVFVPGGLKLVDVNGDKVIDDKDRVVTGNPYADFTWGITNSFTYKKLDVSFTFQGSQGGDLINGDPNYNETKRYNKNYNQNRWLSPMFPGDGKTPYSTVGFNWMLTDYVVEDASYYALREVVIGYSFTDIAKRARMGGIRAYLSIQNLYYHSAKGYRGINTEARFSSGPYNTSLVDGYQRGSFPMPKTFLVGIDINF